ncbi:DUF5985 family protein [Luteolibacter arcticus]|uniref:DUF5985 family protein n=1 Tax=Luteolibacter arcticus TaxID=1581411 RepID=A0ABT3GEC4_9BACT|nr:DUF5985 family protein [Luteolibacter arcticus]MCW1921801.1 DUF5985 family protein [Luteolibacter arcticus]
MLEYFLSGAISMGFFVVVLFFLRFWRTTSDRLFLYFASAFSLLLLERIVRAAFDLRTEWIPAVYLFRLVAFGIILYAVFDKNRSR